MKTKEDIVNNWLPRYTGRTLESFGKYFLLTNYLYYVELFANWHNVPVEGKNKNMPSATADGITILNFGMGSPNAATIMDLLSAVAPNAVLFLGKCGGLKKRILDRNCIYYQQKDLGVRRQVQKIPCKDKSHGD